VKYLACWAANGFSYEGHPAETDAYKVAGRATSLFEQCCARTRQLPCDCSCLPPSVSPAGLAALQNSCANVVQMSSGSTFWGGLADCTPGLQAIGDAARWVWRRLCPGGKPGVRLMLPCLLASLFSGLLWVVYGVYFVIWLVVWGVITVVAGVVQAVVEIVARVIEGVAKVAESLWDAVTSPFRSDRSWIFYTTLTAAGWLVPDVPASQDGHTRTSQSPALAEFNGQLYMAYRSSDDSDIWYNVFDGTQWLPEDIKITQDGHTRTSQSPALAEFNGQLYMAYRSSDDSDIWYNVFDGTQWRAEDCRASQGDHIRTAAGPAVAAYAGILYMAYRDNS
jgi:hypothetical protein